VPIADWCILIAALMPFAFTAIAKFSDGARGFDNRQVRVFQSSLTGFRARAHWAHLNSFEAFPPFAAGVIVAQMQQVAPAQVDGLAIAFIVLRVLYGVCYLANQATLRSVVWFLALLCVVALFVLAGM
jgi:uncharacterized MAPEG superfamily protein